jgi:hypothetical protein
MPARERLRPLADRVTVGEAAARCRPAHRPHRPMAIANIEIIMLKAKPPHRSRGARRPSTSASLGLGRRACGAHDVLLYVASLGGNPFEWTPGASMRLRPGCSSAFPVRQGPRPSAERAGGRVVNSRKHVEQGTKRRASKRATARPSAPTTSTWQCGWTTGRRDASTITPRRPPCPMPRGSARVVLGQALDREFGAPSARNGPLRVGLRR